MELLEVDQHYRTRFTISRTDLMKFIDCSGDTNIIHLDEEAAKESALRGLAVPGVLSAAKISGIHGAMFPGNGTVYVSQEFKWLRPMRTGVLYEAAVEIVSIDRTKHRARLLTSISDPTTGELMLRSVAEVIHAERF